MPYPSKTTAEHEETRREDVCVGIFVKEGKPYLETEEEIQKQTLQLATKTSVVAVL